MVGCCKKCTSIKMFTEFIIKISQRVTYIEK